MPHVSSASVAVSFVRLNLSSKTTSGTTRGYWRTLVCCDGRAQGWNIYGYVSVRMFLRGYFSRFLPGARRRLTRLGSQETASEGTARGRKLRMCMQMLWPTTWSKSFGLSACLAPPILSSSYPALHCYPFCSMIDFLNNVTAVILT